MRAARRGDASPGVRIARNNGDDVLEADVDESAKVRCRQCVFDDLHHDAALALCAVSKLVVAVQSPRREARLKHQGAARQTGSESERSKISARPCRPAAVIVSARLSRWRSTQRRAK